jgi:hypothetical protein
MSALGSHSAQAATVLSSTAQHKGIHKLRGTREADVARFVRAAVGINLQIISDLLTRKDCWAFSLAFDGSTVQGKSFLDVRIRFCVRGRIENVHLIAIPLRTSHTGSQMAQLVDKVMVELCGNDWKANLIGISTDGARNMTEKWRVTVTLLAEGTLPGFFGFGARHTN